MKKLLFPRERKRDSLFGLRKKHTQELKEQQLALYIEKVLIRHSAIKLLVRVARNLSCALFYLCVGL